ncbi:MAG: rRNA maturation RNase YbeY [Ginsengibacter sp.]
MPKILFTYNGISANLKNKTRLKVFLSSIFATEGLSFDIVTFIFCTDQAVLALNQEYLKHDTLTDILTFPLSNPGLPIVAEVYISVERVRENSQKYGVTYFEELHRVMIHGILHLCGFLDHTPQLKKQIRAKEKFYLDRVRFT